MMALPRLARTARGVRARRAQINRSRWPRSPRMLGPAATNDCSHPHQLEYCRPIETTVAERRPARGAPSRSQSTRCAWPRRSISTKLPSQQSWPRRSISTAVELAAWRARWATRGEAACSACLYGPCLLCLPTRSAACRLSSPLRYQRRFSSREAPPLAGYHRRHPPDLRVAGLARGLISVLQ